MTAPNTRWHHSQLRGGLQLAVAERSAPDLLAARLWIAGGSSLDPQGQRGAHQLLAGLLTRGCGGLSAEALADLVEGRGAALRAEAVEDALVISLKCGSDDAEALLPLLIQMASRPRLEPEQLDIERQLNLQSLQRQKEDPFQLCHEALRQLLYGQGPYGHDPLGVETELALIERPQLQTLAHGLGRHGAALVITGTLPGGTEALLERTLQQTPWASQAAGGAMVLPHPEPQATAVAPCEEDTEQVVLMLGCRVPPLGDPDNLPLRLLQTHLGAGMSSRLFLAMREERGLAYDIGVHMPARRGPTPFIWHLSTVAERAGEAVTALLDEWQQLLCCPLKPAELQLARAKYRGQEAMGRQTCGQIADRQALLMGFGLPAETIAQNLDRAESLEGSELQQVAQQHLQAPSLSLCGPKAGLAAARAAWQEHPLINGSAAAG
ncbi:MAG: pitrilysin family protein [Cyanobacteriota bacterium]|nr:pitrilysin family protein [Cyanobacteriota bacterium]